MVIIANRESKKARRTFWLFAAGMGLDVLGSGEGTNPVLPSQLDFDDFDGLVARVVSKVLEEDSSRQERDVERAWNRRFTSVREGGLYQSFYAPI